MGIEMSGRLISEFQSITLLSEVRSRTCVEDEEEHRIKQNAVRYDGEEYLQMKMC